MTAWRSVKANKRFRASSIHFGAEARRFCPTESGTYRVNAAVNLGAQSSILSKSSIRCAIHQFASEGSGLPCLGQSQARVSQGQENQRTPILQKVRLSPP